MDRLGLALLGSTGLNAARHLSLEFTAVFLWCTVYAKTHFFESEQLKPVDDAKPEEYHWTFKQNNSQIT